jgi:excinuclease UvrABC nuclease subunit
VFPAAPRYNMGMQDDRYYVPAKLSIAKIPSYQYLTKIYQTFHSTDDNFLNPIVDSFALEDAETEQEVIDYLLSFKQVLGPIN